MKKVISLFLILFFLVAMVPSSGFCEDKDKSGAVIAGTDAGGAATEGISTGTIVLGVVVTAAVVTVLAIALSGGSTSNH